MICDEGFKLRRGECVSVECLCPTADNPYCCNGMDWTPARCEANCEAMEIGDESAIFPSDLVCTEGVCPEKETLEPIDVEEDVFEAAAKSGNTMDDCGCTFQYAPVCCR